MSIGYYDKLKQYFPGRGSIGKSLRESFGYVSAILSGNSDVEQRKQLRMVFNVLVLELLQDDGVLIPARRDVYRRLLEDRFDHGFAEKSISELFETQAMSIDDAIAEIGNLEENQRRQLVEFLLTLAVALGGKDEHIQFVYRVCDGAGINREGMGPLLGKLQQEAKRRQLAVGSGWGLLAALVVLLVFVIAAKLLQSVIYGLIIACVLLPLEKFFERKIRSQKGFVYKIIRFFEIITYPLARFSRAITRKDQSLSEPEQRGDAKRKAENRCIRQSVALSVVVAILVSAGILFGLSRLTGQYMEEVRGSVRSLEAQRQYEQMIEQKNNQNVQESRIDYYVDKVRERFENLPPVRSGVTYIGKVIKDPDARGELLGDLYHEGSGVFRFTAALVGGVIAFLCNVLLSVFFALLFLLKLAQFCREDDSDKQKSEYLVRFVFNGVWLPAADDGVVREARRIIEGVFFRLRVWLKGYLTLVFVDASVYTTVFFFLGLPFFLPLGLLAGCGILLPYLGPVISCCITLLVAMAAGDVSGTTLLLILISYLIYNGIIEQFILYPAVIGEALGLSTLETIIVVLLGAIFAGITGMLLALPVASVAKYIVPQFYRSFIRKRHDVPEDCKS